MMNARDRDFIEDRLLAPAVAASDAHERLQAVGEHEVAGKLMDAMQEFNERCRAIRLGLFHPERG